ncbi:A24 family peptidase [Ralstonia sp. ASV6]|uniref:prepilin peptidase n=1 Tax=Ralstonia sp. ASV6 TaxID=2795124 RepID=UPI0018ECEB33|nr:A24 family peptidase [Ralstonia sp. ASV6]
MTGLLLEVSCLALGLGAGAVAPLAARHILHALAVSYGLEPSALWLRPDIARDWVPSVLCAIACGALALVLLQRLGTSPLIGFVAAACYVLLILSLIDLHARLLPDFLTVPMLVAGLVINSTDALVTLPSALLGAALGYAALWAARQLSMRTWRRAEGIGLGDAKLLAALGAWLGWGPVLEILIAASIAACVVGAVQTRLRATAAGQILAFGPFISAAGMVALLTWPFSPAEVLATLI